MRTIAAGSAGLLLVLCPIASGQSSVAALDVAGFGLPVLRSSEADPPRWLGSPSAAAPVAAADEAWEQSFAPYLWVFGMDGKVTVKGHTAPVDLSIGDTFNLLDDLDLAFIGHYEARRGDAGFFADLVYFDLPHDTHLPNGAKVETSFSAGVLELGSFQELRRWDGDATDAGSSALEVLGGVRLWSLDVDLDIDSLGVHAGGDEDWADPFVGLRVITQLDERWAMTLRGDVGGFGLFDGSDGTWQLTATVTCATSESGQLGFGWRTLSVDYDHANFAFDTRLSGPFVGYNFRF